MKTSHVVLLAILVAAPAALRAGEMHNVIPNGSVAESKRRGFFVEELAVSPQQAVYEGQTIRIEEAWIEQRFRTENFLLLFQRRRRLKRHWLCVRLAAPTVIAFRNVYLRYPSFRCEGSKTQSPFTHLGDISTDPVLCFDLDALREEYRIQIANEFPGRYEPFVTVTRLNPAPSQSTSRRLAPELSSSVGPRERP